MSDAPLQPIVAENELTTTSLLRLLIDTLAFDETTKDWSVKHPAGRYVGLMKRRPTIHFKNVKYEKPVKIHHVITDVGQMLCIERDLKRQLSEVLLPAPFCYSFKLTQIDQEAGVCCINVFIKPISS